jgi:PBP1b-binding outer membrane lipoprotein LpoB
MKQKIILSIATIGFSLVLSGCCMRPCTASHYSQQQTIQTPQYVQPIVETQNIQTIRYIDNCVAYGYNNQCIAW